MGHEVTLGGERLGGGKRNKVQMHGYERSTHDLSYLWRSTMASGTLVPFMSQLVLPGDTFDIDLDIDVLTHPTVGPLFGSYKVHADVFLVPIRLYQAALHMNMLGIGMDMSKVLLPQVELSSNQPNLAKPIDNQQINQSCIFKYLGIAGMGKTQVANGIVARNFNAIPWLGYIDIYKNYYANKAEGVGAVIHTDPTPSTPAITTAQMYNAVPTGIAIPVGAAAAVYTEYVVNETSYLVLQFGGGLTANFQISQIMIQTAVATIKPAWTLFSNMTVLVSDNRVILEGPKPTFGGLLMTIGKITIVASAGNQVVAPVISTFPLTEIDSMRLALLQAPTAVPYQLNNATTLRPYKYALENFQTAAGPPVIKNYAVQYAQEGLLIRTYASDLFNNWVDTNLIDGANGITAVTSVNVVANKFTIDELNLSKKVYEMLNRIALSGGSYDDWLDAVYTHDRQRSSENPMYMGGLIRNLVFQEVISNTATADEPLGTLAGRGKMGGLKKGGHITIKVDEPSYIISIASIVPNIDYSQGNQWDTNLRTLNDLHKPALDEIGFQNLITDQMAWFDTEITAPQTMIYRSAGKQPAWINYMTNVNKVLGNFADEGQQMFMVLNRRYDVKLAAGVPRINDLTTYIDPVKFNHIFADTRLDAQNFWVQIACDITARRKMSAKVIPNL